jgi:hypothetical protein
MNPSEVGLVIEENQLIILPSLPIRNLWKFHLGCPITETLPAIHL